MTLPTFTKTIMGITVLSALSAFSLAYANVKAQNENTNLPVLQDTASARSIMVDYTGHPQKTVQSKFAQHKNAAQEAAVTAIHGVNQQVNDNKLLRKSRDAVIAYRQHVFGQQDSTPNKKLSAKSSNYSAFSEYLEFDIYTASTVLFEDVDYDGFFRTFSVTFDADVYGTYTGQRAQVFADLYLSQNGGPWELYFTTEAFTIVDDASEDEFEVLTTLDAGYRTQHYDVLIDLYEVGYSDIVATISSENVDSLYALPLESADRDRFVDLETSTSIGINAGSITMYSLLGLFCVLLGRWVNTRNAKI